MNCSVFFFKQKTAYEMRISDWSSDVFSSDLCWRPPGIGGNDFPLTSSPAGLGRRGRTASRPTRILSSGGRSRWTAMPATTEMLGDFVRAALGNMPSVQRADYLCSWYHPRG